VLFRGVSRRNLRVSSLAVIGVLAVGLFASAGPASAEDVGFNGDELRSAAESEAADLTPMSVSEPQRRQTAPGGEACTTDAQGKTQVCVARGEQGVSSRSNARAAITLPAWCVNNLNGGRLVTRTQDCETFELSVTKRLERNGVWVVVGTARITVGSYQYTSFSTPVVAHQLSLNVSTTTGDVAGLTMAATSSCAGSCIPAVPGAIPTTPVTLAGWHEAESFAQPTTTALGSISYLSTAWNITVNLVGGTTPPSNTSTGNYDLRCDNAAGGSSPTAGCAVHYAPGAVTYSAATNPTVVNHISQALASGLPGGSVLDPLHRTTVASVIALNRSTSCGSAVTIPGYSCDEFPFASSYEGAASGGTARSFPGCTFADPAATGPIGFSRCMVIASENSSAGAILGNIYRQQRILEADPFYVRLT
jgi:hypothetical protein